MNANVHVNVPAPDAAPPPEEVRMAEVSMPSDLPAWILKGPRSHRMRIVFVPGMCVHPLGYAQSFQWAAADRGDFVTLQADVSCGGDGSMRRWSSDLVAQSNRIDAVLRTIAPVEDVTLVGYSQGAERIEWLATKYPAKYTRLVLIASPIVPSPERLKNAKRVALMAGTRDPGNAQTMREGARRLAAAKIPVKYFEIPDAAHGQMGTEPERVMAEALDFVGE